MKNFFLTLFGGTDKEVQVVDLAQYACLGFMCYRLWQWSQFNKTFNIEPIPFVTEILLYLVAIFGKVTLVPVIKAFANLITGLLGRRNGNGNNKKEQK